MKKLAPIVLALFITMGSANAQYIENDTRFDNGPVKATRAMPVTTASNEVKIQTTAMPVTTDLKVEAINAEPTLYDDVQVTDAEPTLYADAEKKDNTTIIMIIAGIMLVLATSVAIFVKRK